MSLRDFFDVVIRKADAIGKIGGAVVVLIAGLIAVPWVDGLVKATTGFLYGVQGAVYYEVGPGSDAMFASGDQVDGGLFLLRDGARDYDDLVFGDVLQAGTKKNFRSLEGEPEEVPQNPMIFVLRPGECVVVLSKILEISTVEARSGGWIRVATAACGLFR